MISRGREIFFSNLWKSKNVHSLEYLRYLYTTLNKNQNITENNNGLLVEAFRLIAEIIIWGDQNDSSIIEFFLEKNIMSLFLKFMNEPNGLMIHKQLLQTLSIIFENISEKGSIYYLLSNNHVNAIIRYAFDFKDEEVMAYYISFLKALSMKLNKHTIHFFYNEHINDFALFNEALKFFNQHESMVRTAVRIITLNIFKVADKAMIRYIRVETADPYFNSLMWFIGNRMLSLDKVTANDSESPHFLSHLQYLVHEHLDHLHYINDILSLNVEHLNEVLINSLLKKLYIPLCICSLSNLPYSLNLTSPDIRQPHLSFTVSMFLLAQVFFLIKDRKVVNFIANIIFTGIAYSDNKEILNLSFNSETIIFEEPTISLEETLNNIKEKSKSKEHKVKAAENSANDSINHLSKLHINSNYQTMGSSAPVTRHRHGFDHFSINDTTMTESTNNTQSLVTSHLDIILCMKTMLESFDLIDDKLPDDYNALLAMCLFYSIIYNESVDESLLINFGLKSTTLTKYEYNISLMDKIINIFNCSVKYGSTIRLVTLELACILVETLVCSDKQCWISDEHFAYILTSYEESKLLLRNYYKSEDIFADMFEDEHLHLQKQPLNFEYLLNDSAILVPSNIKSSLELAFRLPLNDEERARYSIRVFLLLRQLCDKLKVEEDSSDIIWDSTCVTYSFNHSVISLADKFDLTNRDWTACNVEHNGKLERQFLVIDEQQILLVEPGSEVTGWGIVRFIGFIRNIQFTGSRDDNKCLLLNLYNHFGSSVVQNQIYNSTTPTFEAKLIFDDHIRCIVAQKRFEKCQKLAHQLKLQQIALMLDFPTNVALGINSSTSNIEKEYKSGYHGPKENILKNSKENNFIKSYSLFSSVQNNEERNANIQNAGISESEIFSVDDQVSM